MGTPAFHPITPKKGEMGTPAVHLITPEEGEMGSSVGAQS